MEYTVITKWIDNTTNLPIEVSDRGDMPTSITDKEELKGLIELSLSEENSMDLAKDYAAKQIGHRNITFSDLKVILD